MSGFAIGLAFGLGYFLIMHVIPFFWRLIRNIRWQTISASKWKHVRRKDKIGLAVALLIVVLFEIFLPSSSMTGHENPPDISAVTLKRDSMANVSGEFSSEQLASAAPWLSSLDPSSAKEGNESFKELNKQRAVLHPAYAEAKEAYNQAKNDLRLLRITHDLPSIEMDMAWKHPGGKGLEKNVWEEYLILKQKYDRTRVKYRKLLAPYNEIDYVIKAYEEQISQLSIAKLVNFSGSPTEIYYGQNLVNYFKPAGIDLHTKYRVRKRSHLVTAPSTKNTSLLRLAKLGLKAFSGKTRAKKETARRLSCNVQMQETNNGELRAERFCELVLPIPANYDLTDPDCPESAIKNSLGGDYYAKSLGKNWQSFCVERWIAPELQVLIFKDRLIVFEPTPLSKTFHPLETTPNSRWFIKLNGDLMELDGKLEVPLPNNFFTETHLHLVQAAPELKGEPHGTLYGLESARTSYSKSDRLYTVYTRVWSDIDIDLPWFSNPEPQIMGPRDNGDNRFTEIAFWLSKGKFLDLAGQYLGHKPVLSRYKKHLGFSSRPMVYGTLSSSSFGRSVLDKLDDFKSSIQWLGTFAAPQCSFSEGRRKPEGNRRYKFMQDHPRLKAQLEKAEGRVDCEELAFNLTLIDALSIFLESKAPKAN
jgi:hypothetical protein